MATKPPVSGGFPCTFAVGGGRRDASGNVMYEDGKPVIMTGGGYGSRGTAGRPSKSHHSRCGRQGLCCVRFMARVSKQVQAKACSLVTACCWQGAVVPLPLCRGVREGASLCNKAHPNLLSPSTACSFLLGPRPPPSLTPPSSLTPHHPLCPCWRREPLALMHAPLKAGLHGLQPGMAPSHHQLRWPLRP